MPDFNYNAKTKQPFVNTAEGGKVASDAGLMRPKGSVNGKSKPNALNELAAKLKAKIKKDMISGGSKAQTR